MKLVNNCGLEEPFVDAMANDQYTGNSTDFSASNVFKGPREYWYDKEFNRNPNSVKYTFDEQVMFMGTLAHNGMEGRLSEGYYPLLKKVTELLPTLTTDSFEQTKQVDKVMALLHQVDYPVHRPEITDKYTVEKRYYCKMLLSNGETITMSGAIDLYAKRTKTLYDYKSMIVGGYNKRRTKIVEWTNKLNFYRLLMYINGEEVPDHLKVLPLIMDWRQMGLITNGQYPKRMYESIALEVLPLEEVRIRIKALVENIWKYKGLPYDQMPYCNPEQRMQNDIEYKVYRNGAKSCIKGGAFKDLESAQRLMLEVGPATHEIREILSGPANCQYYCKLMKAGLCDAYSKWKVGGNDALLGLPTAMADSGTEHEVQKEKAGPDTIDLQKVFSSYTN